MVISACLGSRGAGSPIKCLTFPVGFQRTRRNTLWTSLYSRQQLVREGESVSLPLEKFLEPQRAAKLGSRWPESRHFSAEPGAANSGRTTDGIFLYKDQ